MSFGASRTSAYGDSNNPFDEKPTPTSPSSFPSSSSPPKISGKDLSEPKLPDSSFIKKSMACKLFFRITTGVGGALVGLSTVAIVAGTLSNPIGWAMGGVLIGLGLFGAYKCGGIREALKASAIALTTFACCICIGIATVAASKSIITRMSLAIVGVAIPFPTAIGVYADDIRLK